MKDLDWMSDSMYNYNVPKWKKKIIKYSFKCSVNLGVKVLWKLAPFSCVG